MSLFEKIFSRKILSALLYLNALFWFVFAILLLLSDKNHDFQGINLYTVISFLMFVNALFFFFLSVLVFKKHKWSFYLVLPYLLVNFFLTLTDQFGLIDLLILLLNFISIIYCIVLRKELLPKIDLRQEILEKKIL